MLEHERNMNIEEHEFFSSLEPANVASQHFHLDAQTVLWSGLRSVDTIASAAGETGRLHL